VGTHRRERSGGCRSLLLMVMTTAVQRLKLIESSTGSFDRSRQRTFNRGALSISSMASDDRLEHVTTPARST
jgi:hypothetical protein